MALPALAANKQGELYSVSCWAADGCYAVGAYTTQVVPGTTPEPSSELSEVYNGSSWSLVNMSSLGAAPVALYGVSCLPAAPSPKCFAAGFEYADKLTSPLVLTTTSAGNWRALALPALPSPPQPVVLESQQVNTVLKSISCTAPGTCVAVGYTGPSSDQAGLSLVDTAGHWVLTPPVPGSTELSGVACTEGIRLCFAVGSGHGGAIAEALNGTTWSVQKLPTISVDSVLSAVTCATKTGPPSCVAVGYTDPPAIGVGATLVLRD
jgi:hypothetical protein